MDESNRSSCVRVKRKKVKTVFQNVDKIHELFSVRLCEKTAKKQDVSNSGGWVFLEIEIDNAEGKVPHSEIVSKVQSYVDSLCGCERESCEDSSYDSDFEGDEGAAHPDVSRTVSDTLGAEFAEYVSCVSCPSAGYTARVEFGLKLGYSERLVQAALHKLGPAPAQNELLEELIRLGAQAQQRTQGSDVGGVDDTGATAVAANTLTGAAEDEPPPLRPIVIDGSNVAMSHGNKEVFSCRGIKLCVDWFRARGHKDITVFVPKWRKESSRPDNPVTDQEILTELEKDRCLVFTPSRLVGGKRMVCYDDRYILKLASEVDGIVVSNDNYRDLVQESPEFRKVVAERILMYSFVNDRFMPPDDPLGRSGPTLDNFLRLQQRGDPPPPCPYGKKCTYGNKCKFHHPERGPLPHKSVTERLVENAQRQLQARIHSRDSSPGNQLKGASLSLPLPDQDSKPMARKMPLSRTKSTAPVLAPPPTMIADQKSGVSKSRSVENVAGNQQPHPSENVYPTYQPVQAPLPGYALWNNWGNQFSAKPPQLTEPSKSPPPDNGANLHRKLQRQLTLNPSYDPRLFQLRRGYVQNPHRPLGGRHSNSGVQQCWDHLQPQQQQHQHQSVTRIASAPDTYRPWPHAAPPPTSSRHMHRLSSTSDPQLNLSDGTPTLLPHNAASNDPFDTSLWMAQNPPPSVVWPPQHLPPPPQYPAASSDDARRRLHYHLAYIFPEEQVQKAMQLYPDETNPQKICAAILAMFPKP